MSYHQWAPYVPVAQRRANANAFAKKKSSKGQTLFPIRITGRAMATTFWGKAWCENLENYQDFSNRLPRGRTYARNGSIVDLQIQTGRITAIVAGSDIYEIEINIAKLPTKHWASIRTDCSSSIHSLIDLMRGRFSDPIMQRLTEPRQGMFPEPKEIKMECDCPDYSSFCKHLAAVMYGVGNRLDSSPELLFLLRGVDQTELVTEALSNANIDEAFASSQPTSLDSADLGSIFGIDLATNESSDRPSSVKSKRSKSKKADQKQPPKKRVAVKDAARKQAFPKDKKENRQAVRVKLAGKKVAKKKVASITDVKTTSSAKTAVAKKVTTKAVKKVPKKK